jgi:hypothetical protein
MADVDRPAASSLPARSSGRSTLTVGVAIAALMLLLIFIGLQVRTILAEWGDLQGELDSARHTTVIGYQNINFRPSYAEPPKDWLHDEGRVTLLWSGWVPGAGHAWFKVGRGEIPAGISGPIGRDVIQAIDWPIVEVGSGACWDRIPYDTPVIPFRREDVDCAYPLLVLKKVAVVNETIGQSPVLVTCQPYAPDDRSVVVYDPIVEGRRLTMGHSGYYLDRKAVLYDRGTQSLWVSGDDGLDAFAGAMKGSKLPSVDRPTPVAWSSWRSDHPRGRLIVGADRSRSVPTQ